MCFSPEIQVGEFLSSFGCWGGRNVKKKLLWDQWYEQIRAPLASACRSSIKYTNHAKKRKSSPCIITTERLRMPYGKVPKLYTGSFIGQKRKKETKIDIPDSSGNRRIGCRFSLVWHLPWLLPKIRSQILLQGLKMNELRKKHGTAYCQRLLCFGFLWIQAGQFCIEVRTAWRDQGAWV